MSKEIIAFGDTGGEFVSKLRNNFDEIYSGIGGIGYIIQPGDIITSDSWWVTKASTYSNFVINIDCDFNGETINLPAGITLHFNGGIWSNGTIVGNKTCFIPNGNKQCFQVDLTLTGIWTNDFISPQQYGCITNSRTDVFSNNASDSIQKCVDSIFSVYIPNGFYYLVTAVEITSSKTIICNPATNDVGFTDRIETVPNHVRFYSDKNIDYFVIQAHFVRFYDGFIDLSRQVTFSYVGLKFDTGFFSYYNDIRITIVGSKEHLRDGGFTGYGIYFDWDTAKQSYGANYFSKFDIKIFYCRIGFYIPAKNEAVPSNIDINEIRLNGFFDGNKQEIVINGTSGHNFHLDCQGHETWNYENSLLYPAIYWGAASSDVYLYAVDYGRERDGYYSPFYIFQNAGNDNTLTGPAFKYLGNKIFDYPASVSDLHYNETNTVFSHSRENRSIDHSPVISKLDNRLAYFTKTFPESYIATYDGDGYDFDANLDESIALPIAGNLSVNGSLNDLSDYRINTPVVYFPNDAKHTTDFIEIVIKPSSLTASLKYHSLYLFLKEVALKFRRIQTIVITDDPETYVNVSTYPTDYGANQLSTYLLDTGQSSSVNKIIVRLIGGSTYGLHSTNRIIIQDLFLVPMYVDFSPIIDIGGGQTIYGSLAVQNGVKEDALPVYSDNAAALAGGLTSGMPYRTATGIRMVVYTP